MTGFELIIVFCLAGANHCVAVHRDRMSFETCVDVLPVLDRPPFSAHCVPWKPRPTITVNKEK